jgi:hypothetical protein
MKGALGMHIESRQGKGKGKGGKGKGKGRSKGTEGGEGGAEGRGECKGGATMNKSICSPTTTAPVPALAHVAPSRFVLRSETCCMLSGKRGMVLVLDANKGGALAPPA